MKFSAVKSNIFAVCCGLLLLVAFELLLRFAGFPRLVDEDPFVGFDGSSPVFIEETPGLFSLNPAKENYFNPQSFTMPKPEGTFRVISLGGSTTYGRPFLNETSFSVWLQKLLVRYGSNPQIESLNLGGISYASYRVRRVLEEMLTRQPDLVVIYAGHNEFLENRTFEALREEPENLRKLRSLLHNSASYSLLHRSLQGVGLIASHKTRLGENVSATLEQIGGPELYHRDNDFRDRVFTQYQHEITEMVRLCREAGVPVVLCTIPSNLSGLSPFKSEHRDNLEPELRNEWQRHFEAGETARREQRIADAWTHYQQALQIDSQYALLHYRAGQILELQGRYHEAFAAYSQAKDHDIVPLRALDQFNLFLREFAERQELPLADVEATFTRLSPNGIPGANLFADHVHPSIEGQQLIAWVVLNAAVEAKHVPLDKDSWRASMNAARNYLQNEYEQIPRGYEALGNWGVGRLFYWAGKFDEAEPPLLAAWQEIRTQAEIPVQLGNLALRRKDVDNAMANFDAALQIDPELLDAYMGKAKVLILMDEYSSALEMIRSHSWPEKQAVEALIVEGQALVSLGELDAGLEKLSSATRMAPDVANIQLSLALGLVQADRFAEAQKVYAKHLKLSGHTDPETAAAEWRQNYSTENNRRKGLQ